MQGKNNKNTKNTKNTKCLLEWISAIDMWIAVYIHKLTAVIGVQGHTVYVKGTSP